MPSKKTIPGLTVIALCFCVLLYLAAVKKGGCYIVLYTNMLKGNIKYVSYVWCSCLKNSGIDTVLNDTLNRDPLSIKKTA